MTAGSLPSLTRSYLDLRWNLDPVAATQAGVTAYDDRYGRYSADHLAPHLAALKSIATALEELDIEETEAEIDRTALLDDARVTLRRFERERPQARDPDFWLSHLLGGLHSLLQRRDRGPEDRAVAVAGRLEDVPKFLEDARASLADPVAMFAETALQAMDGGAALVRQAVSAAGAAAPAQQA
ncbi:MAG: DUF885 family protein, partial [Acidimicrobiales bacterium]